MPLLSPVSSPFPLRHRPLSPSRHCPPPCRLLLLSQHPSLTPALSWRPPTLRHRPSLALSAPLPSGTVQSNRTERRAYVRSCLAEWRAFVQPCLAERRAMAEQRPFIRPIMAKQRPFVRPNRIERRPSVWSCLAERCRKGGGAGGRRGPVPESRRGAPGESRCRRMGEGFWERRREKGGRCWEGERDGTGEEMYKQGVERKKEE